MRVGIADPAHYAVAGHCILYILADRALACRKRDEVCERLGFPPFDGRYDGEDGLPDTEAAWEAKQTLGLRQP